MRCSIIGVVALAVILTACAEGSAIVQGKPRPPIDPGSVVLYIEPPTHSYELVGLVRAHSLAGLSQAEDQKFALEELKKQAAAIGANGIILLRVGDENAGGVIVPAGNMMVYAPSSTVAVEVKAIYTKD